MLKFLYIFCALFPILRTWTAKPRNTTKSCQIPDDQETFADSDRLLTESSKKLAISWKGGFHDSISTQENASTDRFHSFHCPLRSQDKPGWEQRASVVLHGWRMVKENIYSKQAACPCLMPGSRGQFSCQSSVPSLAFRIPCKKKCKRKKGTKENHTHQKTFVLLPVTTARLGVRPAKAHAKLSWILDMVQFGPRKHFPCPRVGCRMTIFHAESLARFVSPARGSITESSHPGERLQCCIHSKFKNPKSKFFT